MAVMCPSMLNATYFRIVRRTWREDRGDVTEEWTMTDKGVYARVNPLAESETATQDGILHPERLSLVLPWMGEPVRIGDRLVSDDGRTWEVVEGRTAPVGWLGSQRITVEAVA